MKKILTLFTLVAFSATMLGQTPKVEDRVATLEGQVKSLHSEMATVQSQLSELRDRYAEYQKQLNLKQITKVTLDNFEYGVLDAVGDKATGTVTVTLCVVNKDAKDDDIQFYGAEINDFDGNIYDIDIDDSDEEINIGSPKGGMRAAVRTDIPVKIYMTFKNVAVGARIANLHTKEIAHHKDLSTESNIDFRDININWK